MVYYGSFFEGKSLYFKAGVAVQISAKIHVSILLCCLQMQIDLKSINQKKPKIDIRRQSIDSPDGIHHLFLTKAVYPDEIKACPNVFGQFNLG